MHKWCLINNVLVANFTLQRFHLALQTVLSEYILPSYWEPLTTGKYPEWCQSDNEQPGGQRAQTSVLFPQEPSQEGARAAGPIISSLWRPWRPPFEVKKSKRARLFVPYWLCPQTGQMTKRRHSLSFSLCLSLSPSPPPSSPPPSTDICSSSRQQHHVHTTNKQ